MYAFPKIYLPEKAIKEAQLLGEQPDFFYAKKLLEETGVFIIYIFFKGGDFWAEKFF